MVNLAALLAETRPRDFIHHLLHDVDRVGANVEVRGNRISRCHQFLLLKELLPEHKTRPRSSAAAYCDSRARLGGSSSRPSAVALAADSISVSLQRQCVLPFRDRVAGGDHAAR